MNKRKLESEEMEARDKEHPSKKFARGITQQIKCSRKPNKRCFKI